MSNVTTHLADEAREAVTDEAHDVRAAAQQLRSDLSRIKDDIISAVRGAISAANDGMHTAGDEVRQVYDRARQEGAHAAEKVEASVSKHPLTSIALAAGLGMLVGLWMRRSHY